jgi:hypothetical protein
MRHPALNGLPIYHRASHTFCDFPRGPLAVPEAMRVNVSYRVYNVLSPVDYRPGMAAS